MNLLQLATAVGQKLGTDCSDPNSRDGIAVRNFCKLRHDQLWRSFLWKDSLCLFSVAIDPTVANYVPTNNYMPTKGNLILPPIISKVIAARTTDNRLDVERPMVYFRVNPDEFKLTGTPLAFHLLSACAWELDSPLPLFALAPDPADNMTNLTLDELQADGVSIVRSVIGATAVGAAAGTTDRLDNIIKPVTQGIVTMGWKTPNLIAAGSVYNNVAEFFLALAAGAVYTVVFGANETALNTIGGNPNQFFPVAPGQLGTFTAAGNITLVGNNNNLPVTAKIFSGVTDANGFRPILTLQAADLSAPKCQRIRLMPTPTVATTVRVLGKCVTPDFNADTDSPGIAGMDGILFALAYYDFASRDERGGSADAQSALNEAVGPRFLQTGQPGGFLQHLIEEEVFQAAHESRIMPENGFGDPTYYGANETSTKFWS